MKLTARYLGSPERPLIGELFEAQDHRVYFQFDSNWRDRALELSPFYLPTSTEGSVPTPTPAFSPLFGLFDDSMPDWWGEQLLKRFFGDRGIPWRRVGPLQKLAAQGAYGIGAIAYEPDEAPKDFRSLVSIEVGALAEDARRIIAGETRSGLTRIVRSGMTAGGAQPKALVHFSDDFGTIWPGGTTPPAESSAWVLKFQIDREVPDTREEHAYHLMAAAAGISVPETRLIQDPSGYAHFISRRFDRNQGGPIHLHSYSGLTHEAPRDGFEYGRLIDLARVLCRSESAAEEFFQRAVFNVAAGNDDDHGRNHAFLMDSAGRWTPSPAYDLTPATNPLASNLRSAAVMGRFADISRADLLALGREQALRRIDDQINRVLDAVRSWPEFAGQAGLSDGHATALASEMPGLSW